MLIPTKKVDAITGSGLKVTKPSPLSIAVEQAVTPQKEEVPDKSLNLTFSYLSARLSWFTRMDYDMISDRLNKLSAVTSETNFIELANFGEIQQKAISDISSRLMTLKQLSISSVISKCRNTIAEESGFMNVFSKKTDKKRLLRDFITDIDNVFDEMMKEQKNIDSLKTQIIKAKVKLEHIYALLLLIIDEIVNRQIMTLEQVSQSNISKRVISVKSSLIVAEQLEATIGIIEKTNDREKELFESYKNHAIPLINTSLTLSEKEFEERVILLFKN